MRGAQAMVGELAGVDFSKRCDSLNFLLCVTRKHGCARSMSRIAPWSRLAEASE